MNNFLKGCFKMIEKIKEINKNPKYLFYIMPIAIASGFTIWRAILNNFVVEKANFTGMDIGILQGVREIPGLLSVTVLLFLLLFSEQTFIVISLLVMGFFISIFGMFDGVYSLSFICLLMSFGFHYNEALRQSLSSQLLTKEKMAPVLGRASSIGAIVSICSFLFVIASWKYFNLSYKFLFAIGGSITIIVAIYIYFMFPKYNIVHEQQKKPRLYKKYTLYYLLNMLSGGRRQLFVVFAPFLMIEKFNLEVDKMVWIFVLSQLFVMYIAPKIGRIIPKIGEKKALIIEYLGLIVVFLGYTFIKYKWQGVGLYVIDNVLFSISFALSSYFKKIGEPKDFASTSALTFTLNHVIAVFLPFILGALWNQSHQLVFAFGCVMAFCSFVLSLCIAKKPTVGKGTIWSK